MAFEFLTAEVEQLVNQMQNEAEDHHELHLLLTEKIRELRAFGMPVPEDLVRFEESLRKETPVVRKPKRPH